MTNEEKQIEELGEAIYLNCNACLFGDEAKMIAKFVIEEQGYRKQREWFSTATPPEEGQQVFVLSPRGIVYPCRYESRYDKRKRRMDLGFYRNDNRSRINARCWMPVPEQQKGCTE